MDRLARLAALAFAAQLLVAPAARAEPAMWTIRDKDSTIVLFGSFHLLPPGAAWEPAGLGEVLAKADDIWFEIPLDGYSQSETARQALAHSQLPAGQTLSAMLSRQGRLRLKRIAMFVGAPLDSLDRMQPWYAETVLSVAFYRQQGAVSEEGVERMVNAAAPAAAGRRAFETGPQQIAMFDAGTDREQVASLEDTLRQFETDPGFMPRVLKLWLAGDAKGIDRTVLGPMRRGDPGQYRTLIVERNRAWLPIIRQRLQGAGQTVMVVGVGHLVGPDGVPALLRKQGIAVQGP